MANRTNTFAATREQQSVAATEDYTELVFDLIEEKGIARVCDIARRMGISHVTALRTIRRIEGEGFLTRPPSGAVELTIKGKRVAAYAKKKHQALYEFLLLIGVPSPIAKVDAEGMEHFISPTTLEAIVKATDQFASLNGGGDDNAPITPNGAHSPCP